MLKPSWKPTAKTNKNSTEAEIRKKHKKALHQKMDTQIESRLQRMKKAIRDKDTQQLWILITAAIEAAYVDYFKLKGKEADKMRGRSKVRIKNDDLDTLATARLLAQSADQGPAKESDARKRIRAVRRRIGHIRTQANRLTNLARDIHAQQKNSKKPGATWHQGMTREQLASPTPPLPSENKPLT